MDEVLDKGVESVESESASSEVVTEFEAETDAEGNTFLPGTAPIVVKALVDQVKRIEIYTKPAFAVARDALVADTKELSRLAHENIQHFSKADEKGKRVYEVGDIRIEITFEKEKIKTKITKEDDE